MTALLLREEESQSDQLENPLVEDTTVYSVVLRPETHLV